MRHKDTKTQRHKERPHQTRAKARDYTAFLCAFVSLCLCVSANAQSGDTLFQTQCAQCHNPGNAVGAPLPETLRQMSWQAILAALETGKMTGIGNALSATDR